jgi:hypothetical protein
MELGALAGPDIEILGGMLADPTSATGMIYGPKSIAQQIGQTRQYLDNRTQAVEKVFGRKVPTANEQAPTAKFDMLPPASQYDGKRMRADNGTIYRSVGGKWVKE